MTLNEMVAYEIILNLDNFKNKQLIDVCTLYHKSIISTIKDIDTKTFCKTYAIEILEILSISKNTKCLEDFEPSRIKKFIKQETCINILNHWISIPMNTKLTAIIITEIKEKLFTTIGKINMMKHTM
jgi:hypothetical protein